MLYLISMSEIERRRFLEVVSGGLAGMFVLAQSSMTFAQSSTDRTIPLDTSKTRAEYGFRHKNGLIIMFDYDGYASQFGDGNPYFFPGQTDVNTATRGIRQPNSGLGTTSNLNNVFNYGGSFETGTGTPQYRLEGAPKIDGKSNQLDLTCNSGADSGSTGPDFGGAAGEKRTEPLEPLTPQEIATINRRLQAGEIKLLQPPPIYRRFDMYELPDGKILMLAYDRSRAVVDKDRAYLLDPRTGRWTEHSAEYHAPDARHPQMGAGWETDIGFLQYQSGILTTGSLWYEKQGNSFVNPKPTRHIGPDSPLYGRTMRNLLGSPISNGLRTRVPNPCDSPVVS